MRDKPSVYIAFAPRHKTLADVLQAYLQDLGLICVRRADGNAGWEDEAKTVLTTMDGCDALILLDCAAFRAQQPNWEFQHAQILRKPLVIVSLDRPIDEFRSNAWLKLVDFSERHNWQHLLRSVQALFQLKP